jgi:nucleoside phosphorylase
VEHQNAHGRSDPPNGLSPEERLLLAALNAPRLPADQSAVADAFDYRLISVIPEGERDRILTMWQESNLAAVSYSGGYAALTERLKERGLRLKRQLGSMDSVSDVNDTASVDKTISTTTPRASRDRQSAAKPNRAGKPKIDFIILTAIEVERKAVCDAFNLEITQNIKIEGRAYWRGQLPLQNGEFYEIVVGQCSDAGNADSQALTIHALRHWRPAAALFCGIAGSPSACLGDVVIAREVFYHERGKETPGGVKLEPKVIPSDSALFSYAIALPDWLPRLPVPRPDDSAGIPVVRYAVVASGERVIADESIRNALLAQNRKIEAIAMEDYGFAKACHDDFNKVRHLVARGISDDGTVAKDDAWHKYAAAAAADFVRCFLRDRPLKPKAKKNTIIRRWDL